MLPVIVGDSRTITTRDTRANICPLSGYCIHSSLRTQFGCVRRLCWTGAVSSVRSLRSTAVVVEVDYTASVFGFVRMASSRTIVFTRHAGHG